MKQEEDSNLSLRQFAVYSSLFGAFLVFIGIFKLNTYYSHFGISIVDYLDFAEIITSFLDDIWFIVYLIVLLCMHAFLALGLTTALFNVGRSKRANSDVVSRNLRFRYLNAPTIVVSTILSLGSFLLFAYFPQRIFIYTSVFFLLQSIMSFEMKFLNKNKYSEGKVDNVIYILMLFVTVWLIARLDIIQTETRYKRVSIDLLDKKFVTSNDTIYLGKTDRFIFLFQKSNNTSTVIPVSEVKLLTIKTNK